MIDTCMFRVAKYSLQHLRRSQPASYIVVQCEQGVRTQTMDYLNVQLQALQEQAGGQEVPEGQGGGDVAAAG